MPRTVQLIMMACVSVGAQLGLAVLGAGGPAAFFARPASTAIFLATIALTAASLLTDGNLSSGEKEDRGNRWVLAVFFALMFVGAYVPPFTDRIEFWTLDGDAMRWAGVFVFVAGGVLRLWPVFVLGRRFSGLVAIQPGHELMTNGIFGRIRNPSYLGLLVSVLGWALAFRSGVGVLITALWIPPLIARIHAEESLLRAHFGAAYEAYCARTARLIPGVY